jgi:aldehyde dehydrogenase (NAD+)
VCCKDDGWDKQFIDGSWRTGKSSHSIKDINPYTGATVVEIAAADRDDLTEAYQSAARAQPAWAGDDAGATRGRNARSR